MKAKRKMPKSPGPHSPKLAPLESEIMEQHLQGKTISAIRKWLKTEKKISIAYSNLYNFIHRRAEKFSKTSGTAVILHFMHLNPEIREEVLQILLMLMHKENDVPFQKSIRKQKPTEPTPAPAAKPPLEDYMKIKPGDPPAIIRLNVQNIGHLTIFSYLIELANIHIEGIFAVDELQQRIEAYHRKKVSSNVVMNSKTGKMK